MLDFFCIGAAYNKTEGDNISFDWVGDNYLLLFFSSPARVGRCVTKPNAVLVYGPGERRDYGSCGGFMNSYCNFEISPEVFASAGIRTGEVFYPKDADSIKKILKKMAHEKNSPGERSEFALTGLALQLLAETARGQLSASGGEGEKQLRLRKRFEALREEYLSDPLNPPNIDDMARSEFFSRAQFYRLYKRFFGITPKCDLLNVRLERAKELLTKTRLSTAEIAVTSGFGSSLNLYRSFKAHTGMTVRQWREKN